MAEKGTYPEMTSLMEAAMDSIGAKTIGELSRRTGLTSSRANRELYKWWNGENRPRLDTVLPLLRALGMLSPIGEEITRPLLDAEAERDGRAADAARAFAGAGAEDRRREEGEGPPRRKTGTG